MLCRFEHSIFQSQDGYCVFSYQTNDKAVPEEALNRTFYQSGRHITAVGYHLPATDSIEVDLHGKWKKSKYGLQLEVSSFNEIKPADANGIVAYLSSGLIKGIGPETARAIVARFGKDTLRVIEEEPDRLLQVKGIAQAKLERIKDSYQASQNLREITAHLAPFGVTLKKIMKIEEAFGAKSLQIVKEDPFQLCEVKGFGFLTVDSIARKAKVSLRNPLRYIGALNYCLEDAKSKGHLYLPVEELIETAYDLLNYEFEQEIVPRRDVIQAIESECDHYQLYNENGRVYLPPERAHEVYVAKRVVEMLTTGGSTERYDFDQELQTTERILGYPLALSQRMAVKKCLENKCSILTGGPGTGKTTTLRAILDIYRRKNPMDSILLVAPTGKASRRMSEQTGYPACTLHRALGLQYDDEYDNRSTEPMEYDFIIVDECSMVDMKLAYELFMQVKRNAKLLLVGDPDQLPSVGAGNVLREMIRSELVPVAVLDQVFRQADNSRIALNAYAVNHNDTHLLCGDDFVMLNVFNSEEAAELIIKHFLQAVEEKGVENVQILSPFRRRGAVSADSLNATIRDLVNPKRRGVNEIKSFGKTFREGDRVIQTKNSKDMANGDVGIITSIQCNAEGESTITIKLLDGSECSYTEDEMETMEHSYCISIHKSQGGEFPVVIIPLLREHYIMLRRNLLYTAISRAKEKVVLVSQPQAVYTAIHKCDVDRRYTVLADRIRAYYNREQSKKKV